ncbi:MAG: IPExxxVDY family protein [Cyclobacteriaceae bacterium]|nr:IPExxxVDY family protein [Cyclobacteriaceae bacterium]
MSKKKLDLEVEVEAAVVGIVTSLQDYKLAWKINQVFKIELKLENDLEINLAKGNKLTLSNYCYQTDFFKIDLIKNKGIDNEKLAYLAKELKQIDYFLLIEGEDYFLKTNEVVQQLQSINEIAFVQLIDTTKLKSRDNFIF